MNYAHVIISRLSWKPSAGQVEASAVDMQQRLLPERAEKHTQSQSPASIARPTQRVSRKRLQLMRTSQQRPRSVRPRLITHQANTATKPSPSPPPKCRAQEKSPRDQDVLSEPRMMVSKSFGIAHCKTRGQPHLPSRKEKTDKINEPRARCKPA